MASEKYLTVVRCQLHQLFIAQTSIILSAKQTDTLCSRNIVRLLDSTVKTDH